MTRFTNFDLMIYDSGPNCCTAQICFRRRSAAVRNVKTRDEKTEKIFSKAFPPKLYFQAEKSKYFYKKVSKCLNECPH